VGEPAGVLFDTAVRDDQHEYVDKSLREVGHGICRAAPGCLGPASLETPEGGTCRVSELRRPWHNISMGKGTLGAIWFFSFLLWALCLARCLPPDPYAAAVPSLLRGGG
jgi:hypothetical protein